MGLTDSDKGNFVLDNVEDTKLIVSNIESKYVETLDLSVNNTVSTNATISKLDVTDIAYFEDNIIFNNKAAYDNPFMGWDEENNTFIMGKIDISSNQDISSGRIDELSEIKDNKLTVADLETKRVNISDRVDIRNHAEIHNKLNVYDVDISGRIYAPDYFFFNPDPNMPDFSLADLIGPPKPIIGVENTTSFLTFQIEVIQSKRYAVGFTPNPLPQINTLTVELREGLEIKKEWELNTTDIPNWDLVRYFKFSKQNSQDYFDGNETYTFYNTPIYQGILYNITLTFRNFHPSSYPSTFENLILPVWTEVHRPNMVVTHTYNVFNGSVSTVDYNEDIDPSFNLIWDNPGSDNVGTVNKYMIEYVEEDCLNNHDLTSQAYDLDPKSEIKTIGPVTTNEILMDISDNILLEQNINLELILLMILMRIQDL